MANPKWDETIPAWEETEAATPSWDDTTPTWDETMEAMPSDPEISQLESGARGAAQGLTFGFADELSAGARSVWDDIESVVSGRSQNTTPIKRDEMGRVLNPEAGSETYERNLEDARQADRAAQEANPFTYGSGVVGGGVASAFVPGLNALNVGKGAKALTAIGKGAAGGGLAGAGFSEADNVQDLAKDVGTGAMLGGAAGGVMNQAPKLMRGAKKAAGWTGKKVANLVFDLTDDQIDVMVRDPKGVKNALGSVDLSEEARVGVKKLQEFIKQADDDAWSTLNAGKAQREGAMPKTWVKGQIKKLQDGIKVKGGPSERQAVRLLDTFSEAVDKDFSGKTLSQRELKNLVQSLDNNIKWDAQDAKVSNDVLKTLRNDIDSLLKERNPLYKETMEPVSQMLNNLEKVKNALSLKKVAGEGLVATETTLSKFNTLPKEKRVFSQKAIQEFDDFIGGDLFNKIRASQVDTSTQTGVTQGSRNTLGGGSMLGAGGFVMGGPVGFTLGAAAGAGLGHMKDKFGRVVGKRLITNSSEFLSDSKVINHLGKFAKPLQDAAQRGNNAVGATHFLLYQNNADYRQKIQELEVDDGQQ